MEEGTNQILFDEGLHICIRQSKKGIEVWTPGLQERRRVLFEVGMLVSEEVGDGCKR